MQKVYFSLARATKYAIWPKMSLGRSGIDFDLILVFLGCLREPKMRQSRFQEGGEKIIDFRDPFFSILADFGCPGGSKRLSLLHLFWLFSDPGGHFFCSGAILGHFYGF